jgi:hypothetical protein
MNARSAAIARENQMIDASQSRAIAARQAEEARPRNALEKMAMRLDLSPDVLRNTLMKTAFSACRNNEEFVALVAVANEYQLNPMLKEIYAFPAKGGGIVPMVGYDGWVKLMNSHPMFDGIEYDDHLDAKGSLYGIEVTIWRKDRSHPIKLMELLDECRRGTEPWKMMPSRMLRNRVTCQGARLAFGFSGISIEGDDDALDGAGAAFQAIPTRQSLGEQLGDEIPAFDKQTGEVIDNDQQAGRTIEDEETARALDARAPGNDGTISDDDPADDQRGEADPGDEPAWLEAVRGIRGSISAARTLKAITNIEQDWLNRIRVSVSDEGVIRSVEGDIAAKKRDLAAGGEG